MDFYVVWDAVSKSSQKKKEKEKKIIIMDSTRGRGGGRGGGGGATASANLMRLAWTSFRHSRHLTSAALPANRTPRGLGLG